MLRTAIATIAVGSTAMCFAQVRVIPGEPEEDCGARTPARVCLGTSGTDHCFAPSSTNLYIFGLEPEAVQIGRIDTKPLVLFSATFSGCGSGTLTDYSLLIVNNGEFVNLAPVIRLSKQSEYKVWRVPEISRYPVLATADFIWDFKALENSGGQEETHFARHRYHVQAYVYDPVAHSYIQKAAFDTVRKYKGLDETDEIRVLNSEKSEVLKRLR